MSNTIQSKTLATTPLSTNDIIPVVQDGVLKRATIGDMPSASVDNIADLKAIEKTDTVSTVQVLGYYAQGDGGGGLFYADTADTSSADNGGTIIVADDGTRWKRPSMDQMSILHFGAQSGDDIGPILNAMSAASIAKIYMPAGNYTSSEDAVFGYSVVIEGDAENTVVTLTGASGEFISVNGSAGASATVASVGSVDSNVLTLDDVSAFSVGDVVRIADAAGTWVYDPTRNYRAGQMSVVTEVDAGSDQITLNEYLHSAYTTATTVEIQNTVSPVLSGFVVDGGATGKGVLISRSVNPIVSRVTVLNCSSVGIYLGIGIGGSIKNCSSKFHRSASTGYGILLNDWSSCDIESNTLIDGRAGVDLSGVIPTRYVRVRNNYGSYHTSRAFGSHASTQWCDFSGNHCAHNKDSGVYVRGASHSIRNNTFVENEISNIIIRFGAGEYSITGNQGSIKSRINPPGTFRIPRPLDFGFQEDPSSVFVSGNVFGFEDEFLRVFNEGINAGITMNNLIVIGNAAHQRPPHDGLFVSVIGDISELVDFGMTANIGNPATWFSNTASATLTNTTSFDVGPEYPTP